MNIKQTKPWKRHALYSALALILAGGTLLTLSNATATPQRAVEASNTLQQGPASFSAVIQNARPAVVSISTSGKSTGMHGMPGQNFEMPRFPEGSPFSRFFEEFSENYQNHSRHGGSGRKHQAVGSGFIVSVDGYVVTNYHVVEDADNIEVVTHDGSRYSASIKGHDAKTDLALIKIEADKPLPYIEFGNSDNARVGDWVVAVGNPFGLGGSVTAGIISARGRDIQSGPFDDYLQIDAPINRGNSGGPLLDTQGRVLGINTAIFSPGGGNVGIGFAIPANMAKGIVDQLMSNGSVASGWLGVHIQPLTRDIADSLRLEETRGALVASVIPGSPAATGDLQPGDIILGVDGEAVSEFRDLPKLVASKKAGSKVTLEIMRKGKTQQTQIKIGQMPDEKADLAGIETDGAPNPGRLGIQLAELTPGARKHFNIPSEADGVLVADVEKNSPAAKAGIQVGSLINMVGQEQVSQPEQVVSRVREAAREKQPSVLLLVEYDGEKRFIAVKFATS